MLIKILPCLLIYLVLPFLSFATEPKSNAGIGFPFVQNYPKSVYKSGNKNWSVTKDERGVMYYGNSEGLLAFDGEHWQLHRMPQNIIVRAVAADGQGKIYAGGFAEFGYWSYNASGRFTYHSLTHLVPNASLRDEIWKIYTHGNQVFFQSFSAIYTYENGKIKVIPVKANEPFLFLLKAQNRFFIQVLSKGLYELKKDSLHFIPESRILTNTRILSVLPYQNNSFLIGTAKDGIFIYDASGIKPWENQANDFLKKYQLNNGAVVQGQYYVFGTILNGVVTLNKQGAIVQHINKLKGLQNNTVLSLFPDSEQNLWAGLDNGIDRIDVNSPLFYYFDKTGKFGTVYSSIIHDNKIYLGTNQGLFYSEWSAEKSLSLQSFDFNMIDDTQGQVWSLTLVGDQLLCGQNEGTFLVEGTRIRKISAVTGGYVIKKLTSQPDLLIQGTYTGLVIYTKDKDNNWTFSHKITGFGEPSRYVEEDNSGHIWVSHDYRGIYKLTLSPDLKQVTASRKYGLADGLPGKIYIHPFNLENRMVFSSDAGFYVYDEISDKFQKYGELNQKLGSLSTSNMIIKATGKKYWFVNQGKVALVDFRVPGKVSINSSQFNMLSGHMVQAYENISRISNAMYLISIDDGFVVYNEALPKQKADQVPAVIIRNFQNITDSLVTLTEQAAPSEGLRIPFKQNNVRITYALPYFSHIQTSYQYFLEGYSQNWSAWTTASHQDFTNLSYGSYRFLVRAKTAGEKLSAVTAFEFTVLAPWYARPWAFALYALLTILLLLLFRYLYYKKLRRDQQRMQAKLTREKEEFLQKEAAAQEQRIVKLKNEQLKNELASKSRELANSALNIISKNELLQNLKDEIHQLKDTTGKKLADNNLNKIQKIITEGMSSEQDWHLLESSFNETHENYFKNLKAVYPDLTPNDLKFCAFLRMNMSSKEIASLLNITVRAVEIRRYRLRKKLNLEHEKNLVEFLMEL